MPQDNFSIIADDFSAHRRRQLRTVVFLAAIMAGTAAALIYARAELTLSHYDARAHLVVARRVVDSLTPGWRQLGGVWLPLPHLVNLVPVQWDWAYRTGATGVAISVLALSWGLSALAGVLYRRTGSAAAALAGPALVLLNPNVLYLQSTPMTEPMLIGAALISLGAVDAVLGAPESRTIRRAGLALAALVLIRYEGWFIAAALVGLLAAGLLLTRSAARAIGPVLRVSVFPICAVAAFLLLSRGSTGAWFQTSGFFVPENPSLGSLGAASREVWRSTVEVAGPWLLGAGLAGLAVSLMRARRTPAVLLPIGLLAAAALPLWAFYDGHPHRVRYMVPLVAGCAALAGLAIGALPSKLRAIGALGLAAAAVFASPPLSAKAPMVTEAQWETPYRLARRDVTAALVELYDGGPILASLGSLGHYAQEASTAGLHIADFLHEGNGNLWTSALQSPRRHVRLILIEEHAEGGDLLAQRARAHPEFLDGFWKVIEGGGMALYRRER